MLTFTPEVTGMTWQQYVDLSCRGAKLLFLHETPKQPLQWSPEIQNTPTSKALLPAMLHFCYCSKCIPQCTVGSAT